jgi:hypothetical protein
MHPVYDCAAVDEGHAYSVLGSDDVTFWEQLQMSSALAIP